jgi:hypothetical protein
VTEEVDLLFLTPKQTEQVFRDGKIVPPADQIIAINEELVNSPWDSLTIAMTAEQKTAIREAADAEGISMSDMALKFLATREHVTIKY